MPVITSIKPQKDKNRVNIYLDGKFGFGLDLENFVKLGLGVEQNLTETEIEEIVKKAEFQKTLDKLLRFATLRPHSEKEIKDWLKRKLKKRLNEDLFNKQSLRLCQKLKRLDLIDDEKFARWWIDQRQHFRPKPKRILATELKIKGIDKDLITSILYSIEVDEEKIARDLLVKKAYRWKHLGKSEARKKMSEFLARKGFDWDVIKKVTKIGDF